MNINCTFKNFEPSDHLKKYAATRFDKLEKYVKHTVECELQVTLSVEKFRHMAEVVLYADNIHISAYEESEDMYSTIDMVLDKLEAQLRRMREKVKGKRRQAMIGRDVRLDYVSFSDTGGGGRQRTIVEADRYVPKPMSVDEAAEQLETLEYEFLVFTNAETEGVNVIYRRKNGDFGLIDPGM